MNATFPGLIRSHTAMPIDNVRKTEVAWHALLNRPEARVLSAIEERELLVDLIDNRKQILACLRLTTEQDWGTPGRETEFQQRVRELASSVLPSIPRPPRPYRWHVKAPGNPNKAGHGQCAPGSRTSPNATTAGVSRRLT